MNKDGKKAYTVSRGGFILKAYLLGYLAFLSFAQIASGDSFHLPCENHFFVINQFNKLKWISGGDGRASDGTFLALNSGKPGDRRDVF